MPLRRPAFLRVFAMTNHSPALLQLCECYRGCVPTNPDWMGLIGLANQTLTTPSLMPLINRCADRIPADVCLYVREIFERNLQRNDRLVAQLTEIIEAINNRGITAVLLKGAALLATAAPEQRGSKLMSDLDIMVSPQEVEETMNGLLSLGYSVDFETPPAMKKWYADLKRPSDVGMVDLHCQLPGPEFFYRPAGDARQYYKLIQVGQGSAYVPSATYHSLIMIVHDQFQDHDYWVGDIDLRHLLDLRYLSGSEDGIDWDLLSSFAPDKLARNALETQLVALHFLLGVDVPAAMRARLIPRLQHKRRLAQARFPMLRGAFLAMAMLDYKNHREGVGDPRLTGSSVEGAQFTSPKTSTLRFLFGLSCGRRTGKA